MNTTQKESSRDQKWLENRFLILWKDYFSDIPMASIKIRFGRNAYTRLGSIGYEKKTFGKSTMITMTGYFKRSEIPDYVIDATIAHEICHYAHGYFSPLPKLHRYPHQGSKVDDEMKKRGLVQILEKQKIWLKTNWKEYVKNDIRKRRPRRRRRGLSLIELLLGR